MNESRHKRRGAAATGSVGWASKLLNPVARRAFRVSPATLLFPSSLFPPFSPFAVGALAAALVSIMAVSVRCYVYI